MNITARRISGSTFSAEDKLEVVLNSDDKPTVLVFHTIELVSGINVTHGGGGLAGDYLHYKSVADGFIDYSIIEMSLVQETQGTSVIKVVCEVVTKADSDAYKTELESWTERKEVAVGFEEEFTEVMPTLVPTILKTGEITLEWTADTFV